MPPAAMAVTAEPATQAGKPDRVSVNGMKASIVPLANDINVIDAMMDAMEKSGEGDRSTPIRLVENAWIPQGH
jgi:hypothetical protein